MKQRLIFATGNEHKMKEIREILDESKYEIISMKEAGVDIDIVEDGKTFEENALIKAKAVMEVTGQLTLADDSGLEIDALNGEPGIYSSRYLGEDTSYVKKNSVIKGCTRREEKCKIRLCGRSCISRWTNEGDSWYYGRDYRI